EGQVDPDARQRPGDRLLRLDRARPPQPPRRPSAARGAPTARAGGHTRAAGRRDGDQWVLNGAKQWITSGTLADVAVVWAKTDEGLRGFLVEKGTPGFTSADQHGKLSLRASVTSELGFHDGRIPADAMLPKTTGLKNALMCLTQARYGIAWGALGAAMDCYDTAL